MPMAEQLARRGHQVALLTVSPDWRFQSVWSSEKGVRLGEMPNLGRRYEGYGPLDIGRRTLHTLFNRYDIVHMFDHKPNATFPGFLGGRLRRACLVSDWADWWGGPGSINDRPDRRFSVLGKFEAWWEEKSKLRANGVVTISTVLRQRAIDLGCPAERVLYLPTGAAIERIRPIPLTEARRQLGVPAERRIVGFIGMGQGDLNIVMQAIGQLPDVWLMVIGRKQAKVLEMAHSFGLADRLWQTDFVPDDQVSMYLACADVMCLPMADTPANRGRLPNKLLDYMAAGRPTVASPVGDIKTILQEYKVGLLADDDAFAGAIGALLSDKLRGEILGWQARHVAETAFGWSQLIDRLEGFYTGLLNRAT